MDEEKVLDYAEEQGYDKVKKEGVQYKGYDVYEPYMNGKVAYISLNFILVKGEEIRLTTEEEAEEILDLLVSAE